MLTDHSFFLAEILTQNCEIVCHTEETNILLDGYDGRARDTKLVTTVVPSDAARFEIAAG